MCLVSPSLADLTPVLNNNVGVLTEVKDNFREPTLTGEGERDPSSRLCCGEKWKTGPLVVCAQFVL